MARSCVAIYKHRRLIRLDLSYSRDRKDKEFTSEMEGAQYVRLNHQQIQEPLDQGRGLFERVRRTSSKA